MGAAQPGAPQSWLRGPRRRRASGQRGCGPRPSPPPVPGGSPRRERPVLAPQPRRGLRRTSRISRSCQPPPNFRAVPEGARVAAPAKRSPSLEAPGPALPGGAGRELALGVRRGPPGSCASCARAAIRGAVRHGAPDESRCQQLRGKARARSFLLPRRSFLAGYSTLPHPSPRGN